MPIPSSLQQIIEMIKRKKKPVNLKFTAKIKNTDDNVTGYYCPHLFEGGTTHEPAIIVIGKRNIESAYEIDPETLRPAEEG